MNKLGRQINHLVISKIGHFIYYVLPYRRAIINENINQVFSDTLTAGQKKHLIKAFYTHLATSIKEIIQLRFISEARLSQQVTVKGHEHLLKISAENKGVLIVTGHFGNWEFAPIGGLINFKEFKGQFHFIRRILGNKFIERILFNRYHQAGLNVIAKKNSLHQVQEVLDKNHAVVFVLDQHASLANRDGIAVEFFGKKAGTYRSLAIFARHTQVPVVPAASYRLPNGQHVLEFQEPLYWQECANSQEALYHNTRRYNEALERIIIAHPEQWMWLHRRWKLT